jgi:uncharacterized protein YndB with AHSA1/START domain
VTYISTTPEKLWDALIDSKMTAQYWRNDNVSDWMPGSRWEHRSNDEKGTARLVGKVVESVRPRRLVLTWVFPADEARQEKHTRITFDIAPFRGVVRLSGTRMR